MQIRRWLLCLVWTLMTACGGGGGGGGSGTSEGPTGLQGRYFPLAVGDRWVYADSSGAPDVTVQATGTRRVEGQDGVVMAVADAVDGPSESVYLVSASAVREVGVDGDPMLLGIGALDIMRLPLRVGDSFVQADTTIDTGMDLDGDGRQERAAVRSQVLVVGQEPVTTPLTTFADCLHQRTTMTAEVHLSRTGQTLAWKTTSDDWYAPDIGLVRSEVATSGFQGPPNRTLALVAYNVGGRRSDNVVPTVRIQSPAAGAVVGAMGQISATFSEIMDAASLTSAFTLVDAAGQAVAFTVNTTVQSGASVATLMPAQPLRAGRHVVRVGTAATDRVGNALAGDSSWSFDVDVTGPTLVESTPANGDADVPLNSAIVMRFSEAIDPASVGAGGVSLQTAGTGGMTVYVPFTAAVNGSVLTLTPAAALERARYYHVLLSGLSDTQGNRIDNSVAISFRADAGRFAAPVALAPMGLADAVAVGDVNGDGRADVVFTTGYSSTPAQDFKLMVRLQQADGTLAPATVFDTRAEYTCRASSLAIGDLDRDGRNDVVIGTNGCGIQVFRQGGDGALRAAESIDSARSGSGRIRLVDLNRDGRLDLVAAATYGDRVGTWLQDASGTMVPAWTGPALLFTNGDLDVGDVNGDGRPDIVVSSTTDDSIGLLLQNAGGGFDLQTVRVPGGVSGVSGVAVGDVNGDGRADVVATFGSNSNGRLGVMLQQANGSLSAMITLASRDMPAQIEVADVNGDGRLDVVVGHGGGYALGVYLQQADGTLGVEADYPENYGNNNPGSLAVGDVNGDGRPDIVVAEALLRQRAVAQQAPQIMQRDTTVAGVSRAPAIARAAR